MSNKSTPQEPSEQLQEILEAFEQVRPINATWDTVGRLNRPGISKKTLEDNLIFPIEAPEAEELLGFAAPGLAIPYFDPIKDEVLEIPDKEIKGQKNPFLRMRLDMPDGKRKYHQRAGTPVQVYVPLSGRQAFGQNGTLVVVEGEFKALALTEEGLSAVGISGFWGFQEPAPEQKDPEARRLHKSIRILINKHQIHTVLFLGDTDTTLNYEFSRAAIQLRELLPEDVKLLLPRIPFSEPKGIDDCIEKHGPARFPTFWKQLVDEAIEVTSSDADSLAQELIEMEIKAFPKDRKERSEVLRKLAKVAANCEPLGEAQIVNLIANSFEGVTKTTFKAQIKAQKSELAKERSPKLPEQAIDVGQPNSKWTREALLALRDHTYCHGGRLTILKDGSLICLDEYQLAVFANDPKIAVFFTRTRNGEAPVQLNADLAKRISAAASLDSTLLRNFHTLAKHPVIVREQAEFPKARFVTDYCSEHGILVANELPDFSECMQNLHLAEARRLLEWLLQDFHFDTLADFDRAFILLITPALLECGLLENQRAPFFWIDKSEPGVGGGVLCQIVSWLYGISPRALARHGHKELREDLSHWLKEGETFAYIDNVEGESLSRNVDLCSFLTEPYFNARIPYFMQNLDVRRKLLAATSNGGTLGRDLATRSISIRLRKQAKDHLYTKWNDRQGVNALMKVISRDRAVFVASVMKIVQIWIEKGCKPGHTTGFRFEQWEDAASGILEMCYPNARLMAGMEERRLQLGTSDHRRLVDLFRAVKNAKPRTSLSTTEIVQIGISEGVISVDQRFDRVATADREAKSLGWLLRRAFKDPGTYNFDGGRYQIEVAEGYNNREYSISVPQLPNNGRTLRKTTQEEVINSRRAEIRETSMAAAEAAQTDNCQFQYVSDESALDGVQKALEAQENADVYLYLQRRFSAPKNLETWMWDPRYTEARILALKIEGQAAWLIDLKLLHTRIPQFLTCLAERNLCGHELLTTLIYLRHHFGHRHKGCAHCTEAAARVSENGHDVKDLSLEACLPRYLSRKMEVEPGKWDQALTAAQMTSVCRNADVLCELDTILEEKLHDEDLTESATQDREVIPATVEMICNGIKVNEPKVRGLMEFHEGKASEAANVIREYLGPDAKPDSHKDMLDGVKAKVYHWIDDTKSDLLKKCEHPLTDAIVAFRKNRNLANQCSSILKHLWEDGRVHTYFDPYGTQTGRYTSSKPNLQGLAKEVRECFEANEGYTFVNGDLSQVELRILASVANEPIMLQAFDEDLDLHSQSAALAFQIDESEVTPEQRQVGKMFNFAIAYGKGAKGLWEDLFFKAGQVMELEETEQLLDSYFDGYPGLRKYRDKCRRQAEDRTQTEVRTVSGRRRTLPKYSGDTEWARYTAFLNTPIQGAAADCFKMALTLIYRRLPKGASLMLNIHDDVVAHCPFELAGKVEALIRRSLIEAMKHYFPDVKFEVAPGTSSIWK